MEKQVIPLYPRIESGTLETEERFSILIDRLRRIRIQSRIASAQLEEFGRQFVDDDLYEIAGPTRGQALDAEGRRVRLKRMAALHVESLELARAEMELLALIARLEAASDQRPSGAPGSASVRSEGNDDSPSPSAPAR